MALGVSLILNLSGVINFAHGGFVTLGGYIAYTVAPWVGFWGALAIARSPPRASASSSSAPSSTGSTTATRSTACS